ncbi:MAG: sulfatase-like hydrolase/transferase [Bacteroides sp.]
MKKSTLYLFGFIVTPLCAFAKQTDKPNVILIMADDLGWGDVGFNGNRIIRTPHLDALASDGVVFDRFYAAAPLSSPTRASVLTGRHPFRTGVFSANEGILRPEEICLSEALKEEGYATGHFGKWHLGTLTKQGKDANRGGAAYPHLYNPPVEHGYDIAFVTESKVPTYDPMICPEKNNGRFWNAVTPGESVRDYGTSYWDIAGNKVTDQVSGDDSRVIMDRVLPFIEDNRLKNQPFLSVIWFHAPHLPCVASPQHAAMYQGFSMEEQNYYGCITAMDEQVGRLVAHLKELGLYENTLILFCSDNGPEIGTPGSAGNFKGLKRSLHEGGIRVPAFMVWRKETPAGKHVAQACSTTDYFPTVLDILGHTGSTKQALDGESFRRFANGSTRARSKPLLFGSMLQGAVLESDYKLYYSEGQYELYNIEEDPFEQKDLHEVMPKKAKHLKKILYNQFNEYKDSFDGKEYGTESVKRMKQEWHTIFKNERK